MKYIIDAYNLLNHPLFKAYLSKNPEDTAKSIVLNLRKEVRIDILMVFDGTFSIPPDLTNFVRTSGPNTDADTYIINLLSKEGVDNKIVVTNDTQLSMRVKSRGGKVMSVEDFFQITKRKTKRTKRRATTKDGITKREEEMLNKEAKKWFLNEE